jgi:hypothetical protein
MRVYAGQSVFDQVPEIWGYFRIFHEIVGHARFGQDHLPDKDQGPEGPQVILV